MRNGGRKDRKEENPMNKGLATITRSELEEYIAKYLIERDEQE